MNGFTFDEKDLLKKKDLYLQTFPNYEIVGWFHILPDLPMHPVELSLSIHEQISLICDNPVLMIMNPEENDSASSDLPVRAYFPLYRDMKTEFVEISVKIETGEAERVAVDDIVKGADSSTYGLASHLSTQNNALRMFHKRLRVVCQYMNGVKTGKYGGGGVDGEVDYELLRRINSFTAQLSKKRKAENVFAALDVQELDALVASLMAMVMKAERDKFDLNAKWLALKPPSKPKQQQQHQNQNQNQNQLNSNIQNQNLNPKDRVRYHDK